jgi:DNA-binding transcriptional LysR family regulator
MFNVNRLRILREIAQRGSVTGAAAALYMTPSAVSQQMAVLGRETGVELIERHGRGVRLTHAGQVLVEHTEDVLAALESAEADLSAIREGVAGTLRVCAFPTAARALMVPAISLLRDRHPQLIVTMVDLEPDESLPMLKARELDVVLSYEHDHTPERPDPGVERRTLVTERLRLALPKNHPLVGRRAGMRELSGENWVVARDAAPFLDAVERLANEAGYEPRIDIHSNDYQVILAAVEAGLGVTLAPPTALFAQYPGLHLQPLEGLEVHRRITAAIRRGSGESPAIAAALAALGDVATELAERTPGIVRT